ncbi:MAG: DUF1302 domain-containing protein [Bermanella sp.]
MTKKPNQFLGRKKYLALAIPLLMAAQAQGVEFNMGQIEGSFDSQISMGSSWRVENQDSVITGAQGNSDDGDRNYKNGDAFSQIVKGSHDLQFSYQNFGGFVRGKYWYDSALDNNAVEYGHTPTTANNGVNGAPLTFNDDTATALDDSNFDDLSKAKGATILDAFVYGSFELGEMPLDVRVGKQVVSWGESTFIRGGVNSINPVDINAFVRPGAEIKEGLLPVNMAFANIGLTDNLSMETFYQLEFQETVVPGCGTYFSTSDTAAPGCDTVSVGGGVTSVARNADDVREASDDGQFGLAFRYISEALGDTEFGFYAMNIHSRAPVAIGNTQDSVALFNTTFGTALAGGADAGTAAQMAIGAAVGSAAETSYAIAYPEDQIISGISFATNVGSVALSGEVSHSVDTPVQINGVSFISTLLGLPTSSTELTALTQEADIDIEAFRLFDISQAQVTAIKFFDQVAGASRIALVGEVGYTYIHGFDEGDTDIKYGRSDVYGAAAGDSTDDGFTTESSYGYRVRIVGDYSDVFAGINLKPTIAWSDDVKGYSNPGGNFNEGQQKLGLSVQATYLETYNASIAYTQYMGGDYSVVSDRDFASMSIGMQF